MGLFNLRKKTKDTFAQTVDNLHRVMKQSNAKIAVGENVYLTHVDGMRVKYKVIDKKYLLKEPKATEYNYDDWIITYELKWFRNQDVKSIYRLESDIFTMGVDHG